MVSKLDALKRYASKSKKTSKKSEKSNLIVIDKTAYNKKTQSEEEHNDIELEADTPFVYLEDGITPISRETFNKIAKTQWKPIGKKVEQNIEKVENARKRHDSDSEDEPVRKSKKSDDDLSPIRRPTAKLPPQTHVAQKPVKFEWGPGSVQKRETQKIADEIAYEMKKPLARYKDDADLEKYLKSAVRTDDPMLQYFQNDVESAEPVKINKNKKFYFNNRFNITPGSKWDGIDRSNGFEQRRVDRINEVSHQDKEAFMYFSEEI